MRRSNKDLLRHISTTPRYGLPPLIWNSVGDGIAATYTTNAQGIQSIIIKADDTPHECETIQRMSEAWRNKSND